MDKKQDNSEEKISISTESDKKEKPVLRTVPEEDLKKILADHQKWLFSAGKEGKQADLQRAELEGAELEGVYLARANLEETHLVGASLQNAYLQEANLQGAMLVGADLRGADLLGAYLQEANLQEANLQEANLSAANLQGTILWNADLQKTCLSDVNGLSEAIICDANLDGSIGIRGNTFARSDLTGTRLPEKIDEFKSLDGIEETSKNARKIFFAMLLGCVYSWLTIANTTDVKLLTNNASSPLPIIGTEIPIAWFYWAAPLVLLGLYLYFHLYLDNLWKGLASLPAIFPDGKPLDQRAYPWLLNCIVCRYFGLLKERPVLSRMKEWATFILAWCIVPLTFIGFWLRYLRRHEWVGTCLHIVLIIFSIASAFVFYSLAANTLRGKEDELSNLRSSGENKRNYCILAIFLIGFVLVIFSHGTINGIRWEHRDDYSISSLDVRIWVPLFFEKLNYSSFANLQEQDVSIKPNDYQRIDDFEKRTESVKGANLKSRNLTFSNMARAFLVKADFRKANLKGADLRGAFIQKANFGEADLRRADIGEGAELHQTDIIKGTDLWKADFSSANLIEAYLVGVNLKEANLFKVKLQKAYMTRANLKHARLGQAEIQQAQLWRSDLQKAYLVRANLQEAYLEDANLSKAILEDANLRKAYLVGADLREADLRKADLLEADLLESELEEANLNGASLREAYLGDANLRGANLQGADLWGADFFRADLMDVKLKGANLRSADLTGCINLTQKQLSLACGDEETKLPPGLTIKNCSEKKK